MNTPGYKPFIGQEFEAEISPKVDLVLRGTSRKSDEQFIEDVQNDLVSFFIKKIRNVDPLGREDAVIQMLIILQNKLSGKRRSLFFNPLVARIIAELSRPQLELAPEQALADRKRRYLYALVESLSGGIHEDGISYFVSNIMQQPDPCPNVSIAFGVAKHIRTKIEIEQLTTLGKKILGEDRDEYRAYMVGQWALQTLRANRFDDDIFDNLPDLVVCITSSAANIFRAMV